MASTQPLSPSEGAKEENTSVPAARRRVLLVEDEDDVLEAAVQLLTSRGFDVVTAVSGAMAIAMLQQGAPEAPDAVVLDLMMPGVNGWDVWDWLQATKNPIPIVVWTATGLRTGALGNAPIVAKGRPADLLDALTTVLRPAR